MKPFTSFPKVDPNSPLMQSNAFPHVNHAKSTTISATIDLKMGTFSFKESRDAADETKHVFSLSDHPANRVKIMEDADAKEPTSTPMKSIPVNMDTIIKNSIDSIVANHGQAGLMTVVLWAHVLFGGKSVSGSNIDSFISFQETWGFHSEAAFLFFLDFELSQYSRDIPTYFLNVRI
jgi:hypothetical protein